MTEIFKPPRSFPEGRRRSDRFRSTATLGVGYGHRGEVHDVRHLGIALEDVHRLREAGEDRPDHLRAGDPVEELVGRSEERRVGKVGGTGWGTGRGEEDK